MLLLKAYGFEGFPFGAWDELFRSVLIGNWYEVEWPNAVMFSGEGNFNW